jgi:chemosensory pili system protein ChpA (sensor histidine kinase/response regulator)
VADAIVSIEYYMETVQSGRNDPRYMLDNVEMCIKTLATSRCRASRISAPGAAKPPRRSLDPAETIALERTNRRMRPPIR